MKRFRLINQNVKLNMLGTLQNLPVSEINPLIVTVKEEGRTLDQNALLWPLLECFATQIEWPVNGTLTKLEPEEWKDILSAAFKQEKVRIAQGLNGGMVMLGSRTSKMSKPKFSEFIEFIYAMGSLRGIKFNEAQP